MKVRVHLFSEGRKAPPGLNYGATAQLSGRTWSVVLEFVTSPMLGDWTEASLRGMAQSFPSLQAGEIFFLLEGEKKVGVVEVFRES